MAEIEIYRGIMTIGSELCPVSKPAPKPMPEAERNRILAAMFGKKE